MTTSYLDKTSVSLNPIEEQQSQLFLPQLIGYFGQFSLILLASILFGFNPVITWLKTKENISVLMLNHIFNLNILDNLCEIGNLSGPSCKKYENLV